MAMNLNWKVSIVCGLVAMVALQVAARFALEALAVASLGLILFAINRGSQGWKDHRTYRDQLIRERAKRAYAMSIRR
jgi:hypothetical protein